MNQSAVKLGYQEPFQYKTVALKLSISEKIKYGVTKHDFKEVSAQLVMPFITTEITINGTKVKVDSQGFSECYNETEGRRICHKVVEYTLVTYILHIFYSNIGP